MSVVAKRTRLSINDVEESKETKKHKPVNYYYNLFIVMY
jgi:hypothetical protein